VFRIQEFRETLACILHTDQKVSMVFWLASLVHAIDATGTRIYFTMFLF